MSTALTVIVVATALPCAIVTAAWGTVALSYWWELRHRRSPPARTGTARHFATTTAAKGLTPG